MLVEVQEIRKLHRVLGGRKIYEIIYPFLLEHNIKMGRDALFTLLAANNLLVKRRKRNVYTTNSFHWLRKYPNLIKEFVPIAINQLWVSDITYLRTTAGFLYISLITDAYSHKVVGYNIAKSLEATHTEKALEMALTGLSEKPSTLIHHSDRGIQYCSYKYTDILKKNNILISMTESGDPLENALAERVNGILKLEYMEHYKNTNLKEAKQNLIKTVELYNNQRPHYSIGLLTPELVHSHKNIVIENLWKKKTVNVF